MQLAEQHIIKTDEWREWCIKAKNLYNQSLYYWRQSMFKNIEYFSEYELLKLFREFKEENYIQLPSHCGQNVLHELFGNIKGWQNAQKEYAKNPSKFSGRPKMPKYKKELGLLCFNNLQVKLKNGYVHFPKMIGIAPIKTNIPNINFCRVVPKSNHFVVEFVYTIDEKPLQEFNCKAMGVDLGLNNLATVVSNTGDAFIVNGRPLKAINAFYNKRKAGLQSKLIKGAFNSKRIERLIFKRNNKVKNYIHHASRFIVNKAEELNVTKIIIGNNKNWKQSVNMGSKNNQNFVSIPHSYLIKTIEYKARLNGIEVVTTEESYTSKCSALDLEPICKHKNYVGKRVKRGLFKTANGTKINADCNGAANIIRKVVLNGAYSPDKILRAVIAPSIISVFKQNTCKN